MISLNIVCAKTDNHELYIIAELVISRINAIFNASAIMLIHISSLYTEGFEFIVFHYVVSVFCLFQPIDKVNICSRLFITHFLYIHYLLNILESASFLLGPYYGCLFSVIFYHYQIRKPQLENKCLLRQLNDRSWKEVSFNKAFC